MVKIHKHLFRKIGNCGTVKGNTIIFGKDA